MTAQTLRQYETAHRARTLTENAGLTGAEYDRCYPAGCRVTEWVRAIESAASAGETIPATVADDLYRRGTNPIHFLRTFPNALPDGYMTPDVRAFNREHDAEMVAARRRGREAAQAHSV